MSVELWIPATFVESGWGTPTVCARHGEPATRHRKVRFVPTVPAWTLWFLFLCGFIGLIIAAVIVFSTRETVSAPAWPFCGRCRNDGARRSTLGYVVMMVGLVLAVVLFAALSSVGRLFALTVGAVVMIIGGAVAAKGTRAGVAGGRLIEDAQFVRIRKAHQAFANQSAAAQQAAAEFYAAHLPRPAAPRGPSPYLRPAVHSQPPALEKQPPAFEAQPPVLETQPPAFGAETPVLETQPPAFEKQPSAVEVQPEHPSEQ